VCITSYKLVIQDHQAFRRKKWKYLILDEVCWFVFIDFHLTRPYLALVILIPAEIIFKSFALTLGSKHKELQISTLANAAEFP